MTTTIQELNDQLVVVLDGQLDTAAAAETEKAMQPAMECTDRDVVVDCNKLAYISSSGLRLLLALNKKCRANGHKVMLKGLNDDLLKVFVMTGFNHLFEMQ